MFANQADTITDFSDEDQIFLKGSYGFAGPTRLPLMASTASGRTTGFGP